MSVNERSMPLRGPDDFRNEAVNRYVVDPMVTVNSRTGEIGLGGKQEENADNSSEVIGDDLLIPDPLSSGTVNSTPSQARKRSSNISVDMDDNDKDVGRYKKIDASVVVQRPVQQIFQIPSSPVKDDDITVTGVDAPAHVDASVDKEASDDHSYFEKCAMDIQASNKDRVPADSYEIVKKGDGFAVKCCPCSMGLKVKSDRLIDTGLKSKSLSNFRAHIRTQKHKDNVTSFMERRAKKRKIVTKRQSDDRLKTLVNSVNAEFPGQFTLLQTGTLVTVGCCVSASGRAIPPVMVFPRVNYKDHFIRGALPGTLGLASQSGWMTSELFPKVLAHLIKHIGCTKDSLAILLMDNHESHLNLEVMDMARENGLTIVTFPPHCSHRLQPLDVSFYSPLKAYYKKAAYNKACAFENITAGLQKSGIWPFNSDIFTEAEFLASTVFQSGETPVVEEGTENVVNSAPVEVPPAASNNPGPSTQQSSIPVDNDADTSVLEPNQITLLGHNDSLTDLISLRPLPKMKRNASQKRTTGRKRGYAKKGAKKKKASKSTPKKTQEPTPLEDSEDESDGSLAIPDSDSDNDYEDDFEEDELGIDTDKEPGDDEGLDAARELLLLMYGKTRKEKSYATLDELRFVLSSTTDKPVSSLPPTDDAFRQHSLRAKFQTMIWCRSHIAKPRMRDPTEYGKAKMSKRRKLGADETVKDVNLY
ncbi:hypothetical protein GQR58_011823 [Nymphon striatum]|nr:hypothetical protein GQR58_011823 [Nymphon striatum]